MVLWKLPKSVDKNLDQPLSHQSSRMADTTKNVGAHGRNRANVGGKIRKLLRNCRAMFYNSLLLFGSIGADNQAPCRSKGGKLEYLMIKVFIFSFIIVDINYHVRKLCIY